MDFVLEPRVGELYGLEVKVRYTKQRLTSLEYFGQQYSTSGLYIVTLDRLAEPPKGVGVLYPWELYGKFF